MFFAEILKHCFLLQKSVQKHCFLLQKSLHKHCFCCRNPCRNIVFVAEIINHCFLLQKSLQKQDTVSKSMSGPQGSSCTFFLWVIHPSLHAPTIRYKSYKELTTQWRNEWTNEWMNRHSTLHIQRLANYLWIRLTSSQYNSRVIFDFYKFFSEKFKKAFLWTT